MNQYPETIFFLCGTEVWTQGFALAREGLYCLSQASKPSRASLDCDPPILHFPLYLG
jgi:hypothetical protein